MPILPDPRHEKFAQALARGAPIGEAYAEAGYKPHGSNASRLSQNDNIRRRVNELVRRASDELNISLQWLIEKAEDARQLAMSNGQPAGAISAIKEIGILTGLRVERREEINRDLSELSDEELTAMIKGEKLH